MRILLRKWWFILIQGILLIILSMYIFRHPGIALTGFTFWISMLVTIAGITGIIAWFASSAGQREISALFWSIISVLFGLLLISKLNFAMKLLTYMLGTWMIITGGLLILQGRSYLPSGFPGWVMLVTGVLSVIAGFMVIFNINSGAIAVSTIVGIQVLFAGAGLIVLAFAKRKAAPVIVEKDQLTDTSNFRAGN